MATSHTDVRSLVDRFDTHLFRSAVAGGASGLTSLSRHGSAEPVRARVRSRDRRARTSGPNVDRAHPSGPMEATEWMDALTTVAERVSTLERLQRDNAQASGALHAESIRAHTSTTAIQEDLVKYKVYVDATFKQIDGFITPKFQTIEKVISGTVNDQFNEYDQKVVLLQVSFDSLMQTLQAGQVTLPQEFNLTPMDRPVPVTPTGSAAIAAVDPFAINDPWGRADANPLRPTPQMGRVAASHDLIDLQVGQTLPPAVPASFAPGGVTFQSPFETAGNHVFTPPTRPAFVSPPSDGGQAHGQPTAGPFQQYGQAPAHAHYGAQQPYSAVGGPGQYAHGGIGHM